MSCSICFRDFSLY